MQTRAQSQKSLNGRRAFRGAAAGLLGAIVGQFSVGPMLSLFSTSPAWLAPVIVVAIAAIFVMAALLFPLVRRPRAVE